MNRRAIIFWEIFLLLGLVTQIVLRRELAPGEFGTMNTALALVGALALPLLIFYLAAAFYLGHPAPEEEARVRLRAAGASLAEIVTLTWGGTCVILLLIALPALALPGETLPLTALLSTLTVFGAMLGGAICWLEDRFRFFLKLLMAAAVVRLVVSILLAHAVSSASAGLGALAVAALLPLGPALRQRVAGPGRWEAARALLGRPFLLPAAALTSVLGGLFLLINADRLTAQRWFGSVTDANFGLVDWAQFDDFHAATLLSRTLLAALLPLLVTMAIRRYPLTKTTLASLREFWIYLALLFLGGVGLVLLRGPIGWLLGDGTPDLARFIRGLAFTLVPMGILQGLGFFVLASRRLPECFTLGGAAVLYFGLIYAAGRRPELMTAYMFMGSLLALLAVFVVGVVRYARNHP